MKHVIGAILILLISSTHLLAQMTEASSAVSPAIIGGPLRQSAAREARRLATAHDTRASQSQSAGRMRHPVLLGAVIGGGAGFVLNATACRTGESVCTSAGNLLMAGIGAGIGATIGALASR